MTNVPEPGAQAEAARRHAIALVRARLDEIVGAWNDRELMAPDHQPSEGNAPPET
jgi:hypothetical protein